MQAEKSMNPQEVKELLDQRPFRPFRVRLTNSEILDINRRFAAAIDKRILFVVLPSDR